MVASLQRIAMTFSRMQATDTAVALATTSYGSEAQLVSLQPPNTLRHQGPLCGLLSAFTHRPLPSSSLTVSTHRYRYPVRRGSLARVSSSASASRGS